MKQATIDRFEEQPFIVKPLAREIADR